MRCHSGAILAKLRRAAALSGGGGLAWRGAIVVAYAWASGGACVGCRTWGRREAAVGGRARAAADGARPPGNEVTSGFGWPCVPEGRFCISVHKEKVGGARVVGEWYVNHREDVVVEMRPRLAVFSSVRRAVAREWDVEARPVEEFGSDVELRAKRPRTRGVGTACGRRCGNARVGTSWLPRAVMSTTQCVRAGCGTGSGAYSWRGGWAAAVAAAVSVSTARSIRATRVRRGRCSVTAGHLAQSGGGVGVREWENRRARGV